MGNSNVCAGLLILDYRKQNESQVSYIEKSVGGQEMGTEEFTMYNRNKVENDESYLKKLCTYWEGTARGYLNRHVGAYI